MSQQHHSNNEIARQGRELYERTIRNQVEIAENIGKIIAIDLNTGAYEVDQDLLAACDRLRAKRPNAITWAERVGYDAVYAIGGTLVQNTLSQF